MNQQLNDLLNLFFRWIHVVAGITWIGHLYFFNWVNGPFQGKIDGPTKRAVNPELMPRALFWFRWGPAWTWITGFLLAGLIYYQSKEVLFDQDHQGNPWLWLAILLVTWAVGFVVYNAIMKALANKLGGATFGTIMALNVWMIIWPYQKKILTALKEGNPLPATDPIVGIAGLRSRHNTYMSVPLVFFMISNHYPTIYGSTYRDAWAAGVIILAILVTRWLYAKAPKVPG